MACDRVELPENLAEFAYRWVRSRGFWCSGANRVPSRMAQIGIPSRPRARAHIRMIGQLPAGVAQIFVDSSATRRDTTAHRRQELARSEESCG
jgi:hypothetical protein